MSMPVMQYLPDLPKRSRCPVAQEDFKAGILVVVYCFEDSIDLPALLETGKKAFAAFADVQDAKMWIVEELK